MDQALDLRCLSLVQDVQSVRHRLTPLRVSDLDFRAKPDCFTEPHTSDIGVELGIEGERAVVLAVVADLAGDRLVDRHVSVLEKAIDRVLYPVVSQVVCALNQL